MNTVGSIVKHKKDKSLVHGRIREISKSGLRVRVVWPREYNPKLVWDHNAYYKLDMLEATT
jgi:hypothetical protein